MTEVRCLLFGGSGLLGSELRSMLLERGIEVSAPSSCQVDCRDPGQVAACLQEVRPNWVVIAAGRLGGILANLRHQSEYTFDNAVMNLIVLKACVEEKVPQVLLFGGSCMYPKGIARPIRESDLLTGSLEETSEGYALAKIVSTRFAQYLRREGKLKTTVCILTNLYGDQDRFDSEEGHLIASLIVKMHQAKQRNDPWLKLWGDGTPRRDFLHASDAARACLTLLQVEDPPEVVNVGSGFDYPVREIAQRIARVVGFTGELKFTREVSNGVHQKLLNVEKIKALGWRPSVPLEEGLQRAYQSYLNQRVSPRDVEVSSQ